MNRLRVWSRRIVRAGVAVVLIGVAYVIANQEKYLVEPLAVVILVIAPLFAASMMFWLTRAYPQHSAYLLALLALATLGSFTAEGYIAYEIYRERTDLAQDPRSIDMVVRELRNSDIDAVPGVGFESIEKSGRFTVKAAGRQVSPLAGVPLTQRVFCNERGGTWIIIPTDRYGFANPDTVWNGPQLDVALVGDSLAEGACVSMEESAAALIRKHWPGTANLGIGGSGPLRILGTIREYLHFHRPRNVLWLYSPTDMEQDIAAELKHPVIRRYLEPEFRQGLAAISEQVGKALRKVAAELDGSSTISHYTQTRGATSRELELKKILKLERVRERLGIIFGGGEWEPPHESEFLRVLELAQKEVKSWGGKLYFVCLANWHHLNVPRTTNVEFYRAAMRAVTTLNVPTIDMIGAFRSLPDPNSIFSYSKSGGHYSALGQRVVADTIISFLKTHQGQVQELKNICVVN